MTVSKNLLILLALIVAIPLAVNMALSTQIYNQEAAMITTNKTTGNSSAQPMTPAPSISLRKDTDITLSCSSCLRNGRSDICFNVKQAKSYCRRPQDISENVNTSTPVDINEKADLNVLCIKCPVPSVTISPQPTCTPRPLNYCQGRGCPPPLTPPPGGWCSTTPTPTCTPRPACLDAVPRCLIADPNGGWCSHSPGVTVPPANPAQQ